MSKDLSVAEKLKTKYHKCEEVTNFKDMLERSAEIYKTRTAFKLKDKDGKIFSQTYESFKNDVIPKNIIGIKYTIDLDGINYEKINFE